MFSFHYIHFITLALDGFVLKLPGSVFVMLQMPVRYRPEVRGKPPEYHSQEASQNSLLSP